MRKGRGAWGVGRVCNTTVLISGPGPKPQAPGPCTRGFSIIAALFLIVVLAVLGAFAVRIGAGQQQTVNLQLLSTRALAAANSGIDWGAYRAMAPAPNVKSCGATTLNFTEAALNGFTVNVVCVSTPHMECPAATPNCVYRIDSTATLGTYGSPDFVSRHVYATFTDIP